MPGLDPEFGTQTIGQRAQTDRAHDTHGGWPINGGRVATRMPIDAGTQREVGNEAIGGTTAQVDGHSGDRWRRCVCGRGTVNSATVRTT